MFNSIEPFEGRAEKYFRISMRSGKTFRISEQTYKNIMESRSEFIKLPTGELVNRSMIEYIEDTMSGFNRM